MMKKIINLFIVLLVLGVFVIGCTTPEVDLSRKGPSGQAGRSNVAHLYLYEKTGDPDWDIVVDGAWGKMKYNLSGETFDFVFNGHGLEVGSDYTLIYYPDPWPGTGLICLGSGTVNEEGNVHIAESVDTGNLPAEGDENDGAKIWLVLSADVDCENQLMVDWSYASGGIYLFEEELIIFDDTDV
jgi:hypothetical protein